ncbi:MAG: UPF0403 protein [Ignavibacteriales bacterium]|jgi:putative YphP/YqiW family bacilliredoxin
MLNVMKRPPMYDEESVQPMRDELTGVGIQELRTPEEVEKVVKANDDKTVLVFINSVCGCAAGGARPGLSLALQHATIPDRLTTVFAGQDRDAVDLVRSYISAPPSSPSLAIFKNGAPVYFMPRYEIEGYTFQQIARKLTDAFDQHCTGKGPSVSPEHYAAVHHAKMCGSKIPMYKG